MEKMLKSLGPRLVLQLMASLITNHNQSAQSGLAHWSCDQPVELEANKKNPKLKLIYE